jgi:hypothetical protein
MPPALGSISRSAKQNRTEQLDRVSDTCNLSTQETLAGGCKFRTSLGYVTRPYLKKIKKQIKIIIINKH